MADVTPRLTPASDRIETLDVLRGFALLGILAMNVMVFAMPFAAYSNPTVFHEYEGANRWTYIIVHLLFDQKMMSLFSMLFGAGVVLYAKKATTRDEVRRARGLWFRRMGWLLLLGMIHAYGIWEGDILVCYALCGLLLLWWVRDLPSWLLVAGAIFFVTLTSGTMLFQGWWLDLLTEPENQTLKSWGMSVADIEAARSGTLEFMDPTREQMDEQVRIHQGGWMEVFRARAAVAVALQTQVFLFFLFWRACAMMFLGIVLMRTGVFTGRRSNGFYAAFAVINYLVGFGLVGAGIGFNEARDFELVSFSMLGMQFNSWGSIFVALGHVGLLVLLAKNGVLGLLGRSLAAVGRMALTNYLLHSIICSIIFYGYGFGLYGQLERYEQEMVVLGIWAFQLVMSPIWLRHFRFGPAEWAWRSLTYWKRQPLKR